MKKRVHLLLTTILSWSLLTPWAGALRAAEKGPNVLLIMTDDLGYGDLGCYGQKQIQTPELDRMAGEGLRFTQFYADPPSARPPGVSLMTGMHTGHTEIRGNREIQPMGQWPLADETLTVAECFKRAGYETALIGKWGLGGPGSTGHPNRQGFDYFFGYPCQRHAHNYYPEFLFRNDQLVPLEGNIVNNERGDGGYATGRALYSHDLVPPKPSSSSISKMPRSPFSFSSL